MVLSKAKEGNQAREGGEEVIDLKLFVFYILYFCLCAFLMFGGIFYYAVTGSESPLLPILSLIGFIIGWGLLTGLDVSDEPYP